MRKTYKHISFILAATAVLCSCEHRPVFPEGTLLEIDIQGLQPKEDGTYPELFEAIFYDSSTGMKVTSDFIGPEGGQMHLAAGNYTYVVYNFDLESVYIDNIDSYYGISAKTGMNTEDVNSLFRKVVRHNLTYGTADWSMTDEQSGVSGQVIYEPDPFYVASGAVSVPHRNGDEQVMTIRCTPVNKVRKATLRLKGIKGAEYLSSLTVYITNLSGAIRASDSLPAGDASVLYAECGTDGKGECGSYLRFFGGLPGECYASGSASVIAFVFALSLDGKSYTYSCDITGQVSSSTDDYRPEYVIDCPLEIQEPKFDGDGFRPSLDDWNEETVPVPIGQ